jgi:hypothetical protein
VSFTPGGFSRLATATRLRLDWAGIQVRGGCSDGHQVLLPGDTKVSSKWHSGMEHDTRETHEEQFKRPLRQVVLYCSVSGLRYGFIITDAELYCFRRRKSPEPQQSLSANREQRQTPAAREPGHSRSGSGTTTTSSMSVDGSSSVAGSIYTDDGMPNFEEASLEGAWVPWRASGHGRMTVNLALFFLHLLAAAETSLELSYPEIGSWYHDGGVWKQVGSGRVRDDLL